MTYVRQETVGDFTRERKPSAMICWLLFQRPVLLLPDIMMKISAAVEYFQKISYKEWMSVAWNRGRQYWNGIR
ncbi:11454_t:CDS:2 [Funneliformis geosporum]|nr:11454_t:CDS:2 [Funneliformis geosporum]